MGGNNGGEVGEQAVQEGEKVEQNGGEHDASGWGAGER